MGHHHRRKALLAAPLLALTIFLPASAQKLDELVPRNVALKQVIYKGRLALQLIAAADAANGSSYAIVKDTRFQDGTIEVNVAGKPASDAGPDARGFIGIAFRLRDNKYGCIYLRPTNGRADDQVRRNHSTEYSSFPEIRVRAFEAGFAGEVRVVCGPATWRVDQLPD